MAIIAILAVVASGVFFKLFADNAEAKKAQLIKEQVKSKTLTKSIDKLEDAQADLEKEEEQANRSLSNTKGQLAKAQENLKDKEKELKEQQIVFEDFSKNSAAKESELARLNEDFKDLKDELEDSSLNLSGLDAKITKMEINIDDLDDQIDARNQQLAELDVVKSELKDKYTKLNTEKLEIINSFDASTIELRLNSFDLNWGLATLTAKKLTGLKVGDVLAVDLGTGDSLGIKRSFILRVSTIDNNNVVAQFVTEDASLKQSLAIGQKASLIKI